MQNFTVEQLKDAMLNLYSRKDDLSGAAYRVAFDLLEAKIGEEKMDQFLTAYNM